MRHSGGGDCYRRCGFTLIEITVVAIVLGILASIAVPNYARLMEKSKKTEALAIFSQVQAGYKARLFANETIQAGAWNPNGACGDATNDLAWRGLSMENPNCDASKLFVYDVWDNNFSSAYAPVNANRYVIVAIRKNSSETTWQTIAAGRWIYMDLDTGEIFNGPVYR